MTVFETILNCTPVIPNISHIHNTHCRYRRHVSNFRAGQIIFYWLWYFTMTHYCYDERWVFVFLRSILCIIAFVAYYYATRSMYTERHCGIYIYITIRISTPTTKERFSSFSADIWKIEVNINYTHSHYTRTDYIIIVVVCRPAERIMSPCYYIVRILSRCSDDKIALVSVLTMNKKIKYTSQRTAGRFHRDFTGRKQVNILLLLW